MKLKPFNCLILLVILGQIIGCTPNPIIIERNITVERIVYQNVTINNTIENQCNTTHQAEDYTTYDQEYVLSLIRQVKYCEKNQNKFWNDTECRDELNKSQAKLKDAEEELCLYWNISWC